MKKAIKKIYKKETKTLRRTGRVIKPWVMDDTHKGQVTQERTSEDKHFVRFAGAAYQTSDDRGDFGMWHYDVENSTHDYGIWTNGKKGMFAFRGTVPSIHDLDADLSLLTNIHPYMNKFNMASKRVNDAFNNHPYVDSWGLIGHSLG